MNKYTNNDIPYGTPIGLAKDGHIIIGPYNKDGELFECDDHDVCNGVFLSDNSYAYVTTQRFPYVVGCWGPGPQQTYAVSSTCSSQGCSAGAITFGVGISAMLSALIVLSSF